MNRNTNILPVLPQETNADCEVRSLDILSDGEPHPSHPWWHNLKYLLVGTGFGIVFVKAELVSWFRMQEMFRLQSFHLFGIMGPAIVVGILSVWLINLSVWLINKWNIRTIYGEKIEFPSKNSTKARCTEGCYLASAGP